MNLLSRRTGVAVTTSALLFISACGSATGAPNVGSDNGISGKSVADIESAVNQAVQSKKSFEAVGNGDISGKQGSFDFKVDSGSKQLDGTITLSGGGTMTMKLVASHAYITLDNKMGDALGSGAAILAGKCIDFGDISASGNPMSSSLGSFGSLSNANLFAKGTWTKGAAKQVNGVDVIPLTDGSGSEIDIATKGDALPVQFTDKSSTNAITLTFKTWGQGVNVTAPTGCVTLADIEAQMIQQQSGTATPSADTSTADAMATPTP